MPKIASVALLGVSLLCIPTVARTDSESQVKCIAQATKAALAFPELADRARSIFEGKQAAKEKSLEAVKNQLAQDADFAKIEDDIQKIRSAREEISEITQKMNELEPSDKNFEARLKLANRRMEIMSEMNKLLVADPQTRIHKIIQEKYSAQILAPVCSKIENKFGLSCSKDEIVEGSKDIAKRLIAYGGATPETERQLRICDDSIEILGADKVGNRAVVIQHCSVYDFAAKKASTQYLHYFKTPGMALPPFRLHQVPFNTENFVRETLRLVEGCGDIKVDLTRQEEKKDAKESLPAPAPAKSEPIRKEELKGEVSL